MLLSACGVPRLSSATIVRDRLQRWMRSYAGSPVRLLVAPSGSGKTTVLLRYAQQTERAVAYCALPVRCTQPAMYAALARALNSSTVPQNYAQLREMVSGSPSQCVELIVDDVDNALPAALEELHSLIEEVAPNVTLIYAGRSREALRCRLLVSRGVGDLCDAQKLFFTTEEAALLAQSRGLEVSDLELRRLIDDTDGWAVAVAHTIHRAASEGESVSRALAMWRAESQTFLSDLLQASLQQAEDEDRRTFASLYSGGTDDRNRLRNLEMRGLFVIDDAGTLRLYRALRPVDTHAAASPKPAFVPPLMIKMFRSFEASIQGRDIPWVRRRDQDIIKYLLLKPGGAASRDEIAGVFWPHADRHLATQSVRTACSTIRKAIAEVVGPSCVDLYFRTTPDLQIDLENVVSDVRRFATHFTDGETALTAGDREGAEAHLRASYKLYRGRLLEFEGEKQWYAPHLHIMHDRYIFSLESLAEIALDRGDLPVAHMYVSQARAAAPDRPTVLTLAERISAARSAPAHSPAAARRRKLQTV